MIQWSKLRRRLSKTMDALVLMIAGAWLLTQYLDLHDPAFRLSWSALNQSLYGAFWLCLMIGTFLRPREDRIGSSMKEPSPRWSGAITVLGTGLAAAIFVMSNQTGDKDYLLPAVIALGTAAGTFFVWRFATIHAAEIGEAKFKC